MGARRHAEVERHDAVETPAALAAIMRREQRARDVQHGQQRGMVGLTGPPPSDWDVPAAAYASGYDMRDMATPEGFDMGYDGRGDFPAGEYKLPEPVALRCYDGGTSGGHFFDSQRFPHAIQPIPPMTIIARIRSSVKGRSETFLGWKPIHDGDNAKSEFLLTEDGNLQYRINDGYKQWNVTATPPIRLNDGRWHTVAVVREGDNQSIGVASLYADAFQVGEGYVDGWSTHLQPWATTFQVDLDAGQKQYRGFQGEIADVRIFDEAINAKYVKRIGEEPCIIALQPGQWVHSNLGGHGPDQGEQALRFFRVAKFRGRPLDLVIQNTTVYLPKFAERNGIAVYSVGRINLMANQPTRFSFRLVHTSTDEDVKVDALSLSFFHMEQGAMSGSQEIFTVEHAVDQYFVMNTTSEIFVSGSDVDNSLTFRSVVHSPKHPRPSILSLVPLNPEKVSELSVAQSMTTFGVRIIRASGFSMTMEVVGDEGHARDILFGGNSSIFKQGVATVPI